MVRRSVWWGGEVWCLWCVVRSGGGLRSDACGASSCPVGAGVAPTGGGWCGAAVGAVVLGLARECVFVRERRGRASRCGRPPPPRPLPAAGDYTATGACAASATCGRRPGRRPQPSPTAGGRRPPLSPTAGIRAAGAMGEGGARRHPAGARCAGTPRPTPTPGARKPQGVQRPTRARSGYGRSPGCATPHPPPAPCAQTRTGCATTTPARTTVAENAPPDRAPRP